MYGEKIFLLLEGLERILTELLDLIMKRIKVKKKTLMIFRKRKIFSFQLYPRFEVHQQKTKFDEAADIF